MYATQMGTGTVGHACIQIQTQRHLHIWDTYMTCMYVHTCVQLDTERNRALQQAYMPYMYITCIHALYVSTCIHALYVYTCILIHVYT